MIDYLKDIYPKSFINPKIEKLGEIDNYYLYKEAADSLYIPLKELTNREIELLNILKSKEKSKSSSLSTLENLLTHGIIDDSYQVENVQLVYLKISHLEENNFELWKNTLLDSISEIMEVDFVKEDLVVILFEASDVREVIYYKLKEVIQSLDQDFNILTQGMMGQIINFNREIKNVFTFEKDIFESFVLKERVEGIIMLSEVLIDQLGELLRGKKPKLPKLLNYLTNKIEVTELIEQLFKNQGNLSKTAEDLFIHRNTLSYRIKQFYKNTGFDLNYFPDLILCYLLII